MLDVMRGSSGEAHLYILERHMCGERTVGRPRLKWTDNVLRWTRIDKYDDAKRAAEDRFRWKSIVVNLLLEENT